MLSQTLKPYLEHFIHTYPTEEALFRDPICIPHYYKNPADQEISGLLASCLAYGQVTQFLPKISQLVFQMLPSPCQFLLESTLTQRKKLCKNFDYRFTKTLDILELLSCLQKTLHEWGSLEKLFRAGYHPKHQNYLPALEHFVSTLKSYSSYQSHGFSHLLPDPKKKSPMKRLCLFLRWMIRKKDLIDLGVWKRFPTTKLIIPLDTHVSRIAYQLGLVEEGTASLNRAIAITEGLKQLDPKDPLKYDFFLAHLGIEGWCPKKQRKELCLPCQLKEVCIRY